MALNSTTLRFIVGAVVLVAIHLCLRQSYSITRVGVQFRALNNLATSSGYNSSKGGPCLNGSVHKPCSNVLPGVSSWERPAHVTKVMGLIFYGRRQTASVMDCYLKRNLVKNGGVLDGVIFLERTKDPADLALLDKLIASEPNYIRWKVNLDKKGYASSYKDIENGVMYIKMDDDIVFIEDTAIKSIAHTKATRPDFFIVSANVVNQIMFSWLHRSFDAVKPYLPDTSAPSEVLADKDWRPSKLPAWKGPADFDYKAWKAPAGKKHRWLPVRNRKSHILKGTPIAETDYDNGVSWSNWQIAAQMHYSLLENLENDNLAQYRFPIWDFNLKRMGIQFVAIMGDDINLSKPVASDDEQYFTVDMPTKLGRPAVANGTGLVAHYAYYPQVDQGAGMRTTDVLDRYRAFAQENICTGPMLWTSDDEMSG